VTDEQKTAIAIVSGLITILLFIWGIVKFAGRHIANFFEGIVKRIDDRLRERYISKSSREELIEYALAVADIKGRRQGHAIIYEVSLSCTITKAETTPRYAVYVNIPLPYSFMGAIGEGTVNTTQGLNKDLSAGGILFTEVVYRVNGPDSVGVATPLGRFAVSPNSNAPDYLDVLWYVKYYPPRGRYPHNRDLKMRIDFVPPA
jgi:hypothetical protein